MSSDGALTDTGSTSSRGAHVIVSIWTLGALASTFLGIRVYCKFRRQRGLWWDDCFLFASWILLFTAAISTTVSVRNGFGKHFGTIDSGNPELLRILSLVSGLSCFLSVVASRTSFALTLIRLSEGWLKRLLWVIVVSINVILLVCIFSLFSYCNPSPKLWKPYLEGKCWSLQIAIALGTFFSSYMAVCDIALALLPWRILMRFRMYRREKMSVAIAMSMGVFTCVAAIVKCTKLPFFASSDFTFEGVPFVIWGFAESAVSIMAASIPAIRALAVDVFSPRTRYRMFRSLVISPVQRYPVCNETTAMATSTPNDSSSPNSASYAIANASRSFRIPWVPSPLRNSKQDDGGERTVLQQPKLSTSDITVIETTATGELVHVHIELEVALHGCRQLLDV